MTHSSIIRNITGSDLFVIIDACRERFGESVKFSYPADSSNIPSEIVYKELAVYRRESIPKLWLRFEFETQEDKIEFDLTWL